MPNFQAIKNLQKALNDTTRKIEALVMAYLCLFIFHTILSNNLFRIWWPVVTTLKIPKNIILLTGFMEKIQCNALNIKTVAKQVCFTLFTELRGQDTRELS